MNLTNNNKGVVLITVLLIILLLSSIAVVIGNNYLISLKRAAYLEFQSSSLNIFKNIESLAIKKIDIELNFNTNKLSRSNPLLNNDLYFETEQGKVLAKIIDSSNCFNINSLVLRNKKNYIENKKSIEAFRKLMRMHSVDNNLIEEMIDQVIDWIDIDSEPRSFGLEDYYYTGPLHSPQEYTGKRLFFSVNELKSLPSFRKASWQLVKSNICTKNNTELALNINTLDLDDSLLLSSFYPNMSITDAENIIDSIGQDGVENIDELKLLFPSIDLNLPYGLVGFSSTNFDLLTKVSQDNFYASSTSKIVYGNSKNSYIISRTYNGI